MRALEGLLIVGLIGAVCVGSVRAGTIRYRADLEVTHGFAGIGIGQTGSMFVEHADDLLDQHAHAKIGWYGHPGGPVNMLWSFGGANAVQIDSGFISVQNGMSMNMDVYSIGPGVGYPPTVLKGNFADEIHAGANSMLLKDTTGTALSSDALVSPVFDNYNVQPTNGALGFFGGFEPYLGYQVTDIVPISGADVDAQFTAGSPASLTQPIDTPATPFDIGFDYSFGAGAVAGGATLQVLLDGVVLDSINTLLPDVLQSAAIPVIDPALGNRSAIDLEFLFDGPTGSTMLLDNVVVPGSDLLNGDFQTHSLAAWDIGPPGSVAAVPEATIPVLLLAGVVSLLAYVLQRRKRAA